MLLGPAKPDPLILLLLAGGSKITHSCLKPILEVGPGEQQVSGRHTLLMNCVSNELRDLTQSVRCFLDLFFSCGSGNSSS